MGVAASSAENQQQQQSNCDPADADTSSSSPSSPSSSSSVAGGDTDLAAIPIKDVVIVAFMLGLWLYSIMLIVRAWAKIHNLPDSAMNIGGNMWRFVMDYLHRRRKNGSGDGDGELSGEQEEGEDRGEEGDGERGDPIADANSKGGPAIEVSVHNEVSSPHSGDSQSERGGARVVAPSPPAGTPDESVGACDGGGDAHGRRRSSASRSSPTTARTPARACSGSEATVGGAQRRADEGFFEQMLSASDVGKMMSAPDGGVISPPPPPTAENHSEAFVARTVPVRSLPTAARYETQM